MTSRTDPSPISMFQFIRRAPFSGSAMNVDPPTRQRISVCPKYGIFSMPRMRGLRGAQCNPPERAAHLFEKSNWIRSWPV